METLLRSLRTHCAKLAVPDVGSQVRAFFYKLRRKKYDGQLRYTVPNASTTKSGGHWQ